MALSVEAIVAIVSNFVALPCAVMTIWTLVKRQRYVAEVWLVFLRQVEEGMLSNLAQRKVSASTLATIKTTELTSHQLTSL